MLHHPKACPGVRNDISGRMETWGTLHSLQVAQKAGECPFPSGSLCLHLLQAAQLASDFSRQINLSVYLLAGPTADICLEVGLDSESDPFRELSEATELFTSCLRSFPVR